MRPTPWANRGTYVLASQVEPGPRPARVLPETPETRKGPGLWSTAQPTSATLAPPEVEGIVLPFPPGTSTPEDEVPTRWCAFSLAKVAQEDVSLISLTKISSKNVRRCLVATAYAHCAYIETSRREKGLRATTPQETERFRRARDASAAWRAEMCGKAPPSDDDARRLGHLLSGWNRRNP